MKEDASIKAREYIPVVLLLCLHFALASTSLVRGSPTFDEPAHIVGGLESWLCDDYRINPENGILPQRLMSLPLLFMDVKFPAPDSRDWSVAAWRSLPGKVMFDYGNDPDRLLAAARFAILLCSLFLGAYVYFCSREIFGHLGGLISLSLYALSPSILAHCRLATSDLLSCLFFLACVRELWRLLQAVTLGRLALVAFLLGALCLTKMSFSMIVPIGLILAVARLCMRKPLELRLPWGKSYVFEGQTRQIIVFSGVVLVCLAAAVLMIWLFFGFRYSMLNPELAGDVPTEPLWKELLQETGSLGEGVDMLRRGKVLPEGFLYGFLFVIKHSMHRYSYLNGEFSVSGWWYYFPYCFLVKSTLWEIILGALGLAVVAAGFRKSLSGGVLEGFHDGSELAKLVPYAVFAAVYILFAVASRMNIGQRHILPLYPVLFIFAGAVVHLSLPKGWKGIAAGLALLGLMLLEGLLIWPNYLAYFNVLAGGPSNGYKHLVDSSLDWGQDLKNVKVWLEKAPSGFDRENVYLSYFGVDRIGRYGLGERRMPCYPQGSGCEPFEYKGGTYLISATMLSTIYIPELMMAETGVNVNSINEGIFADLCAQMEDARRRGEAISEKTWKLYSILAFLKMTIFLRDRPPDASVGYSILAWKLTDEEVAEALKPDPAGK